MNTENFGMTWAGGLQKNATMKTGMLIPWGTGIRGWDNERSLENDVFEMGIDNKTLTLKRDAILQIDGMFTAHLDKGEYYVYLNLKLNGKRDKRLSGVAGSLSWRNDVAFTNRLILHEGDKLELELETNYPNTAYAFGVDFIRFQELGKESWFWE